MFIFHLILVRRSIGSMQLCAYSVDILAKLLPRPNFEELDNKLGLYDNPSDRGVLKINVKIKAFLCIENSEIIILVN